jgi:chromosome segregation ATPase
MEAHEPQNSTAYNPTGIEMKKSALPTVLVAELIQAETIVHQSKDRILQLNSEWDALGSRARDEIERDYRHADQNQARDLRIKQWKERQAAIQAEVATLKERIGKVQDRQEEINVSFCQSDIQPVLQNFISLKAEVAALRETVAGHDHHFRELCGAREIDSDETIAAINRLLALKTALPIRIAIREEELGQAGSALLRVCHAHISGRLSPKVANIRERLTAKLTEKFEPLYPIETSDPAQVRQRKSAALEGAIAASQPMHQLQQISNAITIRNDEDVSAYAASILDLGEALNAVEARYLS